MLCAPCIFLNNWNRFQSWNCYFNNFSELIRNEKETTCELFTSLSTFILLARKICYAVKLYFDSISFVICDSVHLTCVIVFNVRPCGCVWGLWLYEFYVRMYSLWGFFVQFFYFSHPPKHPPFTPSPYTYRPVPLCLFLVVFLTFTCTFRPVHVTYLLVHLVYYFEQVKISFVVGLWAAIVLFVQVISNLGKKRCWLSHG